MKGSLRRWRGLWMTASLVVIALALPASGWSTAPHAAAAPLMRASHSTGAATTRASERVLYSFGGADGAGPLSGLISVGSAFFGTTVFGGRYGSGEAYEFRTTRRGAVVRVLHSFGHGHDGNRPDGLAAGRNGALYGVTTIGGAGGGGTIFGLLPSHGRYVERILFTFPGGADGFQPLGAPAIDRHGDLFGVTQFGGTSDYGTVFELSRKRKGFRYRVLYDFPFAAQAQAGLTLGPGRVLYGTTYYGGTAPCQCGTVFSLTPTSSGYHYRTLYSFRGGRDGAQPFAALTIARSTATIYGTTEYGGGDYVYGTVFRLTRTRRGYVEKVLHRFAHGSQGVLPDSPLLLMPGRKLVGTVSIGGRGCSGIGCGTVFELSPSGRRFVFRVLHAFKGPPSDGADPESTTLTPGPGGELLGTTQSGGSVHTCADGGPGGVSGCGTVFAISPQRHS